MGAVTIHGTCYESHSPSGFTVNIVLSVNCNWLPTPWQVSSSQKDNRPLLYSGRSMKNLYLAFVTTFIFSVLFLLSAQLQLPLVLRLL